MIVRTCRIFLDQLLTIAKVWIRPRRYDNTIGDRLVLVPIITRIHALWAGVCFVITQCADKIDDWVDSISKGRYFGGNYVERSRMLDSRLLEMVSRATEFGIFACL